MGFRHTPNAERMLTLTQLLEEKLGGMSRETFFKLRLDRHELLQAVDLGGAKYSERLVDMFIRRQFERFEPACDKQGEAIGQAEAATVADTTGAETRRPMLQNIRGKSMPDPLESPNNAPADVCALTNIRRSPGRPKRNAPIL